MNHLHRNKKYWGSDADEFKPERFASENIKDVPKYAYIPYAKGPRMCIGYNYANFSMKVTLAGLFRQFKISTNLKLQEIEFELDMTVNIKQGYSVKLEKRNFSEQ